MRLIARALSITSVSRPQLGRDLIADLLTEFVDRYLACAGADQTATFRRLAVVICLMR
jgi:hypothetical protein